MDNSSKKNQRNSKWDFKNLWQMQSCWLPSKRLQKRNGDSCRTWTICCSTRKRHQWQSSRYQPFKQPCRQSWRNKEQSWQNRTFKWYCKMVAHFLCCRIWSFSTWRWWCFWCHRNSPPCWFRLNWKRHCSSLGS